jgi:hypothetical protein
MNTSIPSPNVSCNHCSTYFYKKPAEIKRSSTNFCNRNCAVEYRKSLKYLYYTEVECLNCTTKFNKKNSEIAKSPNNFCSKSCSASYNNTHKTYGTRRSKLEIYLEEQIREHYPYLELICNQKTAIESELDFYFPQLRFAIELNGITHYEPIYGEDKFEKIQNNDKRKVIACYEKDIEIAIIDSSSCKYLSPNNKEKYKNIVFDLIEKVRHRK